MVRGRRGGGAWGGGVEGMRDAHGALHAGIWEGEEEDLGFGARLFPDRCPFASMGNIRGTLLHIAEGVHLVLTRARPLLEEGA